MVSQLQSIATEQKLKINDSRYRMTQLEVSSSMQEAQISHNTEEVTELRNTTAEQEARITSCLQTVSELNTKVAEQETVISEAQRKFAELENTISGQEARITNQLDTKWEQELANTRRELEVKATRDLERTLANAENQLERRITSNQRRISQVESTTARLGTRITRQENNAGKRETFWLSKWQRKVSADVGRREGTRSWKSENWLGPSEKEVKLKSTHPELKFKLPLHGTDILAKSVKKCASHNGTSLAKYILTTSEKTSVSPIIGIGVVYFSCHISMFRLVVT